MKEYAQDHPRSETELECQSRLTLNTPCLLDTLLVYMSLTPWPKTVILLSTSAFLPHTTPRLEVFLSSGSYLGGGRAQPTHKNTHAETVSHTNIFTHRHTLRHILTQTSTETPKHTHRHTLIHSNKDVAS